VEVFQTLIESTDTTIVDYVFGAWEQFNAVGNRWITGLMVIFIAVCGYLILVGKLEVSLPALFPEILKLFLVYILVTNAGLLGQTVYELFIQIPETVGNFLISNATGGSKEDINGSVTDLWKIGTEAATKIFDKHGWRGWLFGIIVYVAITFYIVCTAFVLILSKLAISILLALAPFFIALYLFSSTKPFFEGWLRQTATFALVPILLYALLGLLLVIIDGTAKQISDATRLETLQLGIIAPFVVKLIVASLLTTQVLSWAASICGGFALATQGAFHKTGRGTALASTAIAARSARRGQRLYHHLKNRRRTP